MDFAFHTTLLKTFTVPPPTLVVRSSLEGEVETGSLVAFTCDTTLSSSLDSVQITWETPHTNNNRFEVVTSNSGLMYSSTLTLSDVRKEDEGMYTCILRGLDSNGQSITENQSIALTGVSGKI